MSDATSYNKAFMRAKLQALDNLRRDGRLSPSARLVGWEIFSRTNRFSGRAFPSEETIAKCLSIGKRTVRIAIKELAAYGHMTVDRRQGCHNEYIPPFVTEAKIASVEQPEILSTGAESDTDRGKNQPATGAEKTPRTLLRNPIYEPFQPPIIEVNGAKDA